MEEASGKGLEERKVGDRRQTASYDIGCRSHDQDLGNRRLSDPPNHSLTDDLTANDRSGPEVARDLRPSEGSGEIPVATSDPEKQAGDHLPGDPPAAVLIGFADMVRFQGALLAVGLLLGYLFGFLAGDVGIAPSDAATGDRSSTQAPLWSLDWLGFGLGWAVAIGVGVAVTLLWLVVWMDRQGWAWLTEIEQVVQQALVPSLVRCSIWQLACLAALAGVGEELLFRWAIQGGIELGLRWLQVGELLAVASWVTGDAATFLLAAVVSAFLFGLCHAVTRAYWVLASLMGLVFSLMVVSGGGLLAAILAHGLYDFLVFLLLRHQANGKASGASTAVQGTR